MSPPRVIVGQVEIAQIFDVNVRTVQRWENEGFPREEGAEYDVQRCVSWALKRADASAKNDEFESARLRKTVAEAEIREHELQEIRGTTVPLSRVSQMVRDTLELMNQALRNAKRRLARQWAKRLSISEAEAMKLFDDLTEEVRAVLRKALANVRNLAA